MTDKKAREGDALLRGLRAVKGMYFVIAGHEIEVLLHQAEELVQTVADLRAQVTPRSELAEPGLPPCPFCGCAKLYMTSMPRFPGTNPSWDGSTAYAVVCGGCAATGGWGKSASVARRLWSMRAEEKKA